MHYYIISGELSGDLYGSKLIHSLRQIDSNSKFSCWGGSNMHNAGGDVIVNLDSLSYMGVWEVLKNSKTILKNLFFAKKHISQIKPDALILIDYPGFNLQIAKYAKKRGIPVFWFIAPQVWAWNARRVRKMKKYIDKLFVALPFELNFFQSNDINTYYYGHPLIDLLHNQHHTKLHHNLGKPIIALFPGSRLQEINKMLPPMLKATSFFHDYRFVVMCVESINRSIYEDLVADYNIELKFNKDILPSVVAALVTSGTASLELAIQKIPQVVCYKLHYLSYLIAKIFVRVRFISLVNILANKLLVTELIQHDFSVKNIVHSLQNVLDKKSQKTILQGYDEIINQLSGEGCFNKIAENIYLDLRGINKQQNK